MPRNLRIEYAGAMYHVINRGDQREPIFRDDSDRHKFLETLGEACQKTEWQIHAYCLMSNHFHLVVETPQPNLVFGMKWFLGVYTKRFNLRHKLCGHLFAGRYKAQLVDGSGNGYLRTVCDYVHLNPVRAGLLPLEVPLESYPWSSYGWYLRPACQRPGWLRVERLLGEKGIPQDSPAGREEFAKAMERRRAQEAGVDHEQIRRDWILGSEAFRQELLAAAGERVGLSHYGAQRRESATQKAQRLVQEELEKLGWGESDLLARPKGHAQKVRIAYRLRQETTMSLKWIAERLCMGSWTYVSNLLRSKTESSKPEVELPLFK
ncbi:MAG TPA: transposase [Clostridia bacterium]|nr:transposase [Clostridia bacterium]